MEITRQKHFLAILISLVLFLIPFFWMKPGEMDLGGDSSRLYFYDPASYLLYDAFFMVDSAVEGFRTIEPHFYNIPHVFMLLLVKSLVSSSYILISSISGLKLSLSFLCVYLILYTIIKYSYKEEKKNILVVPSILGGFFYIFMPIMMGNYGQSILAHNQVFLNPLFFYLFLIYFLSQKFRYLLIIIFISIIFAPNFAWTSAPPVFAFFPISIVFLLLYVNVIQKIKINFLHLVMALLLFGGLHAFHLIPEIYDLFNAGSYVNTRVFNTNSIIQQLNYFYGVLPLAKLSSNILTYDVTKLFKEILLLTPLIVIVGFILNKTKNKAYLLTGIFFLLTLYLVTANITMAGVKFYEFLFHIPGFSMFRNFIGQWAYIFSFFYALLFAQGLFIILKKMNRKYVILAGMLVGLLLTINAWKFIDGEIVNRPLFLSNPNLKTAMKVDPLYENMLQYIRELKNDGSIISFPFSDCCYSSFRTQDKYAYIGLSPITLLGGKKDYNGYLIISPFGEVFLRLAKEKDYESLKKLLGLLNIRYIFHNDDQKIYDETFPSYTYSTVKQYLPQTQDEYEQFVKPITNKKIYEEGPYKLYEINNAYSLPHFYSAHSLKPYDNTKNDWYGRTLSFFVGDTSTSSAYVERDVCVGVFSKEKCKGIVSFSQQGPDIKYKKINPTKYLVQINNADKLYVLIFSETYHPNWNLYFVPDKYNAGHNVIEDIFNLKKIKNEQHFLANGYANGWVVSPNIVDNKENYTFVVEMTDQRVFYCSLLISILSLMILILGSFFLYRKK